MPSETYVIDILKDLLNKKTREFNELSDQLNGIRNEIAISTSKQLYFTLVNDRDAAEKQRRELRGEMSALRQAIRTLEEEAKHVQNDL